jgi:glutathione peroxidase
LTRTRKAAAAALTIALALSAGAALSQEKKPKEAKPMENTIYSIPVKTIDGKDSSLAEYKGKALLIVNTASECGYTPQYAPLQKLFETYKDKGLTVVAFPANNFGAQEPGSSAEIKNFCSSKYKVTFPLYEKISVKGADIHPLYKHLTSQAGFTGDIKWNFNKFLVDPTGKVVARFDSKIDPMSAELTGKVEAALPKAN